MSVLQLLYDEQCWTEFLIYKQSLGHLTVKDEKDMSRFIIDKEYIPTLENIKNFGFSAPRKQLISKVHNDKKRVVYVFTREENYILKLLTYLLIRKYDKVFANNLFSFRAKHGVKKAVSFLKSQANLADKYVYKSDISDYFNSVDITLLLPKLKELMSDDEPAYQLIEGLLTDPRVLLTDGSIVEEKKGIMAGVPLASFLANVYLKEMDWYFQTNGISYARYSDDIILFASSAQEREDSINYIHKCLAEAHLKMNAKKELLTDPHEKWEFLGISFDNYVFDISSMSAKKLKMKMRRKSRALLRWKTRKNIDNTKAAKAFVKAFNRKLFDNDKKSELTWTRWFFPIINTSRTLKQIDNYMQDCIRYIITEKRNKSRYNVKYDDIKQLGYRNLVHEYYLIKNETIERRRQDENNELL